MHEFYRSIKQDDECALEKIQGSIADLRKLLVEVNGFNGSQRHVIFAYRLLLLSAVVFCGFAAIQFLQANYALGACNILFIMDSAFVFLFCYDKGFSVPRSAARLKNLLVLIVKQSEAITEMQRAHMLRQLRSVGKVAIKVGNFHHLQRGSTPRVLDFSVKNVVRLVMFYRKYVVGA